VQAACLRKRTPYAAIPHLHRPQRSDLCKTAAFALARALPEGVGSETTSRRKAYRNSVITFPAPRMSGTGQEARHAVRRIREQKVAHDDVGVLCHTTSRIEGSIVSMAPPALHSTSDFGWSVSATAEIRPTSASQRGRNR
jgi:hypothetical protein